MGKWGLELAKKSLIKIIKADFCKKFLEPKP